MNHDVHSPERERAKAKALFDSAYTKLQSSGVEETLLARFAQDERLETIHITDTFDIAGSGVAPSVEVMGPNKIEPAIVGDQGGPTIETQLSFKISAPLGGGRLRIDFGKKIVSGVREYRSIKWNHFPEYTEDLDEDAQNREQMINDAINFITTI